MTQKREFDRLEQFVKKLLGQFDQLRRENTRLVGKLAEKVAEVAELKEELLDADSDKGDIANRVKGTVAGVLLRETESGDIKVSFRSDGAVDVDAVAKRFGGGGHRNAAGARLPGPLDEACRLIVEAFNGALPPAGA